MDPIVVLKACCAFLVCFLLALTFDIVRFAYQEMREWRKMDLFDYYKKVRPVESAVLIWTEKYVFRNNV